MSYLLYFGEYSKTLRLLEGTRRMTGEVKRAILTRPEGRCLVARV